MQEIQKKQQDHANTAKTGKHERVAGGVQSQFVRVREVDHSVMCLVSSADPACHEYRAILEVTSTNFTLKAEDEQEVIINGYRAFLKSLSFPIQILVRSQRLDLGQYLQGLEAARDADDEATWKELAHSHTQFVRELASRRTLLEHRFYMIIPAEQARASHSNFMATLLPRARKRRIQQAYEETQEAAQQELDLRANIVAQQLSSIGLHCRRLEGEELIALYYSCLTPDRAIGSPLTSQMITAGYTTRVVHRKKRTLSPAYPDAQQPNGQHAVLTQQISQPSHTNLRSVIE